MNGEQTTGQGAGEQAALREAMLRRFEAWLDRTLAGEAAPDGLDPALVEEALGREDRPGEASADLFAVAQAVAALAGEVRHQVRAFRQVGEGLTPLADAPERLGRVEAALHAVAEAVTSSDDDDDDEAATSRAKEPAASPGDLPAPGELMELIFDLHERLRRGAQTVDQVAAAAAAASAEPASPTRPPRSSLLARLLGRAEAPAPAAPAVPRPDVVGALREGYRMTLSRLEAALAQWEVTPFGRPGEPFDPACMVAVDVGEAEGAPDGTILDVYRTGYRLRGRVLAAARVKVARAAAPAAPPVAPAPAPATANLPETHP